ncbi:hypothetical protein [Saccharopolyspora spinosa]|uniref:hypothetical protein n=1 Tax=Saccharopolyspora spinosa TaxID=60894 RepID=UPI000237B3D7|nr:hypothetical protein [Saccharopolyspora spinosa]
MEHVVVVVDLGRGAQGPFLALVLAREMPVIRRLDEVVALLAAGLRVGLQRFGVLDVQPPLSIGGCDRHYTTLPPLGGASGRGSERTDCSRR